MTDAKVHPPGRCLAVGGSVRDELLGLPVHDRDWVVVGATPQQMVDAGFRPVGRDFPVFLHPQTHEEYALARTERKSAPGYRGFAVHADPAVKLEQDLARRDLTINAMARAEDGTLIDPFGGAADLRDGVLRHVSPAFSEDPVRLLRVARFAARWPHFSVAPDTRVLLRALVEAGEIDALVGERVWQELSRGLMEQRPSRMLQVLDDCGALARLLPAVAADAGLLARLDRAAAERAPLPVRYALLVQAAPGAAVRMVVPVEPQALAEVLARERAALAAAAALAADDLLALIERCDALRRPQRFGDLLWAAEIGGAAAEARPRAQRALQAASGIDSAAIAAAAAKAGATGPAIGAALRHARLAAIETALR